MCNCFAGNIDAEGELEFDCSSLDTNDSDNESDDVDLNTSEHDRSVKKTSKAATKGQNKDGIVFLKDTFNSSTLFY